MGIDRIGKSGGAPPLDPSAATGGVSGAQGANEAFRVDRAAPADATLLDRVRAGDAPVGAWLDERVHAATSHLVGVVPDATLDHIRASLRDRLSTDPMLGDLVTAATGTAPPVEE